MSKTILIVDDSASVRHVLRTTLVGSGYDVLEAVDGKDALARLDGRKLHLVISDVNMPNLDGISFVREVRKLAPYRFTPIIMLTTESNEARMREGKEAGARAWVVKPFQPDQMLAAVGKLIAP